MPPKRVLRGQPRKKSGDNDDSDYAPPPESEPESDEEDDEYQDDEASLSLQPRRRGKKVPIPCTILPDFYGNVYEVNLSGNRGEDGVVIKPDKGKYWDVSMDVLDVDEAEALLDSVPEICEVRDLARAALAPYKEDDPDMRKVGGSGTIGLTWSLQRNRRGVPKLTQLYFFQKKLGIIVDTDYAGSFRIRPVVDAFFAPDAKVYNLDLEVTKFPLTHKAEGAAWWSGIVYFGAERGHLIEQMPIGRVPSYGLTIAQRTVIERLVEENPKHGLRWLLRADGGTEFEVGVSNLGKMTPKAAAAHLRHTNAGLALHGHGNLYEVGKANWFTAGPGGGWESGEATQFTAGADGTGAKYGVSFTAGADGTAAAIQASTMPGVLAEKYARIYYMLFNLALHCAATGERPPAWAGRLLTRSKLARAPLKTLRFRDSVRDGEPEEDLKIVGARIVSGGWGSGGGNQGKFVIDVQREDGGVGAWAAYDMCVAFKLIGPTTRPPTPPNHGTWTEVHHWKKTLKPWPAFPRRSKRARH